MWTAGTSREGSIKRDLAGGMDGAGLPEVDLIWCHQPDARVMMVLIIPREETATEGACPVDGLEPFGEFWLIFQCLEVGFRERVVIRGVWTAVGFDHAEIGQHQGGRLRLHRHGMPGHGVGKQGFEQGCTFGVLDTPADDAAAEDVENDVKIELRPFHRPHQLAVRHFKLSPGQFDPGQARPRLTPRTRPDRAPRPAIRAFDKPDGGAGGVVLRPRLGRRGCDTLCGPYKGRCLHQARLHRLRPGSGRRNAGSVA